MARKLLAKIKRYAVFVTEYRTDRDDAETKTLVYVRRPYNIVEYDWDDATDETHGKTFLEPIGNSPRSMSETEEAYDGVKIFENPPEWDNFRG